MWTCKFTDPVEVRICTFVSLVKMITVLALLPLSYGDSSISHNVPSDGAQNKLVIFRNPENTKAKFLSPSFLNYTLIILYTFMDQYVTSLHPPVLLHLAQNRLLVSMCHCFPFCTLGFVERRSLFLRQLRRVQNTKIRHGIRSDRTDSRRLSRRK